jgi:hypothetical protein
VLGMNKKLSRDEAEVIAAQAFGFLAAEPERLDRFLSLTGMSPDDLRHVVGAPEFLAEVLAYVASDESALLVFAADAGIRPEDIARAETLLRPPLIGNTDF